MLLEAACTDSSVCMARCGLRAAFVWLCESEAVEDHVLDHATVVSRCTSKATSLPAAVLRDVLWVIALVYLKHTVDCVYIEQTLQ